MNHEKVYTICENLCLEESLTKEQIEEQILKDSGVPENGVISFDGDTIPDGFEDCGKFNRVAIGSSQPTLNEEAWIEIGKNLINGYQGNYIINDQGQLSPNTNWTVSNKIYNVKPSNQYTMSWENLSPSNIQLEVGQYDSSGTFLGNHFTNITDGSTSHTLTLFATTAYVIIAFRNDTMKNILFEYGNSKTAYKPYIAPSIKVFSNGDYETIVSKNVYSTDDVVIGEWLGKPLYRKVLKFSLTNGSVQTVAHNISNVDFIIVKDFFCWKSSSGFSRQLNYTYNTDSNYTQVDRSNFKYLITDKQDPSDATAYAVLEYTKTTD